MKTKFMKVDGRYVVKTGKKVAIFIGDDIGEDQCVDVCTGETFALVHDDIYFDLIGEPVYKLLRHGEELEYHIKRTNRKKAARAARINNMCGVHWTGACGVKRIGKNRKLSRRMYPNKKQLDEYNNYLPF